MLRTEMIIDQTQWNSLVQSLPTAHILQSWEWGEFKQETTGWRPERLAFYRGDVLVATAYIGIRNIAGFKVMYVPKGPVLDFEDTQTAVEVFTHLQSIARQRFAIWLKIDPDIVLATGLPNTDEDQPASGGITIQEVLKQQGWFFSSDQVQFRNTIKIDLTKPEDELLLAMSGNTRRKVRTASKKDVTIRLGTEADLDTLYALYRTTGQRDNFLIRPFDYYKLAWQQFMEAGLAQPLIAEYQSKPIAHVILFHYGKTCWYFYGASANEERNRMPNYALQWEAMRWAKARGYEVYDMWGAPNEFDETDTMWGVYEFKRGYRGTITRHIGAWDYAPYPMLNWGYTKLIPTIRRLLKR